jgi:hypothetical protein
MRKKIKTAFARGHALIVMSHAGSGPGEHTDFLEQSVEFRLHMPFSLNQRCLKATEYLDWLGSGANFSGCIYVVRPFLLSAYQLLFFLRSPDNCFDQSFFLSALNNSHFFLSFNICILPSSSYSRVYVTRCWPQESTSEVTLPQFRGGVLSLPYPDNHGDCPVIQA